MLSLTQCKTCYSVPTSDLLSLTHYSAETYHTVPPPTPDTHSADSEGQVQVVLSPLLTERSAQNRGQDQIFYGEDGVKENELCTGEEVVFTCFGVNAAF